MFRNTGIPFLFLSAHFLRAEPEAHAVLVGSVLRNWLGKYLQDGKNNTILKKVQPKYSPVLGENYGKIISTWNPEHNQLYKEDIK